MRFRLLALLIACACLPAASAAFRDAETTTVAVDEYWMYSFEVYEEKGGVDAAVPVAVRVEHQDGPPINFFVLDEDNFARYQREEPFAGIQGERNFGIHDAYSTTVNLYDVATYYLVWDNFDYVTNDFAAGPTTFSYSVASTDVHEQSPGLGLLSVFGVLAALALLRRR